jgi:manganese/zinc/iron transport system substrate-binding protein
MFAVYFFYKNNNIVLTKKKFTIVVTTSIIADAVKNIVGDCAVVHQLMGPGIDPHVYRARESDVHKLAQADLVFYNGLYLEGKMGQVLEGMHYFTKTVAVTDALDKTVLRAVDFDNMYDPHVWFDVSLWATIVHYIQQHIIMTDPDNAQIYSVNGNAYIQNLDALHQDVIKKISMINENQRVLITAHDAFGYFGRAYNFEVIGLQGLSTDSDISTKDIQKLADIIVTKKMHAIFIESSIPHRALIAVQNAVAARGWYVEIGDELYSDALGNEGTQAGSYCGMIMYNINTIINSLG